MCVRVHGLGRVHVLIPHDIPGGDILTSRKGWKRRWTRWIPSSFQVSFSTPSQGCGACTETIAKLRAWWVRKAQIGVLILCVPAGHGRDITPVPALDVLGRGRTPYLILPTRGTVGAGAEVAPVLDLRVAEGGATVKMIFETAVVGPSHRGISCSRPFPRVRFDRPSRAIDHSYPSIFVTLKCKICESFNPCVQRKGYRGLWPASG